MKRSPFRNILTALLVLLLTTVCNLPRNIPQTPTTTNTPTDYLIPPTTRVMESSLQAALESVSPEGVMVFSNSSPALADLEPGNVIVSDTTPVTPDGLLRKVVSVRVEGDKVIVETADAELIEAVHEGHVALERDLKQEDIRASWLMPGITLVSPSHPGYAMSQRFTLKQNIPAANTQPLTYSIDTDLGTGGRIRLVGNASLEPKLETDLNISCDEKIFGACAEIPDLNFMTRIAILENVSLSVKGDATNFNKKLEIARHEFKPITLWLGPVPVVFTPILSVYLQGDGVLTSKVEYAIGQKLTLAAGFRYNSDKGFENLSEATFDFVKPTPAFTREVDIRGVIGGEFKLLLYGVLGPFASLEAGPRMRANISGLPGEPSVLWRAEGCIWLFVGIDSTKVIKLRYQKELYKACLNIAEGRNQPPIVSIQSPNQGTQVYQGETVTLRGLVYDLDGGSVNCRWTSNSGGDPFPINSCDPATVKFTTTGNRTLTLTGTDSVGATANATVLVVVLPPPNILVTIENPLDGSTVGPDESISLTGAVSGGQGPYDFRWSFAFPTDVAGNGGTLYTIGSGKALNWAPSNSVSFGGCEVNAYGRLILTARDSNGFEGNRSIVISVSRIC